MKQVTNITLVENSTAGKPPKIFSGQVVRIRREPDTFITGADGHVSSAKHPTKVEWTGRTAKDLLNITDVIITGATGEVLVDAEVNRNYTAPSDIAGGVMFLVLDREPSPR
jgi:hypothetical protein